MPMSSMRFGRRVGHDPGLGGQAHVGCGIVLDCGIVVGTGVFAFFQKRKVLQRSVQL